VDGAARRGERVLYFALEESEGQVLRNMSSIGLDLGQWLRKGLLQFYASRPAIHGLEMHLLALHQRTEQWRPKVVVMDPITNLIDVGTAEEAKSMLMRLIDFFKATGVTVLFTSLVTAETASGISEAGVSSLMDTWILLRNVETAGERNRALFVLKSRGMAHSNQVRELILSRKGIDLTDVYVGSGTVLTGSARIAQEAREKLEQLDREEERHRQRRAFELERLATEAQMATLSAGLEAKRAEFERATAAASHLDELVAKGKANLANKRMADRRANLSLARTNQRSRR
jgi:circadian clock protein KaiC